MKTENRIIIEEQPHLVDFLDQTLEATQPFVESAFKALKELSSDEFSTPDLKSMFRGKEFIAERITDKITNPSIEGVKINRKHLGKLIELPDCSNFENALDELNYHIKEQMADERVRGILNGKSLIDHFKIYNGEVVVNEIVLKAYQESVTRYAVTEKEKEMYNVFKKLADSINETWEYTKKHHTIMHSEWILTIVGIKCLKLNRDQNRVIPNADFIKQNSH